MHRIALAAIAAVVATGAHAADPYPARPVRMIVPNNTVTAGNVKEVVATDTARFPEPHFGAGADEGEEGQSLRDHFEVAFRARAGYPDDG